MNADVLWHPSAARELPVSTSIVPRPVLARRFARIAGGPLAEPSEAEKADAIRILEEFHGVECMGWLYGEAERVFCVTPRRPNPSPTPSP